MKLTDAEWQLMNRPLEKSPRDRQTDRGTSAYGRELGLHHDQDHAQPSR